MEAIAYYVLLFFFYSFLGWIMEVILGLFQHGRFINRGFLIGPLCPIYGVGITLITLFLSSYENDLVVLFCMSMLLCSSLEYFTSYLMEKIFKNRWWDYSDMKYNVNGRICLDFSFAFGALAVIVIKFSNPAMYSVLDKFPMNLLVILCYILIGIMIIDMCISFNVIITLKNVSNSLKEDSTEAITKKVKEVLLSKSFIYRRLVESFPKMKVSNVRSIIRDRLDRDKKLLKDEKKKYKENKKIKFFKKK